MRSPVRTLSALVALLALLVLAPAAGAATVLTASRAVAVAGETIVFDWRGLADDAQEVELELSLDGGRWIRVSPGLEPREGRFVWTVPTGLVGEARVRLRAGGRHDEQVVAETPLRLAAAIVLGPRTTHEDWWSLESHGAPRSSMREHAVWSALATTTAFTHESSPTLADAPLDIAHDPPHRAGAFAVPVGPRTFTAPRSLPLRN